MATPGKGFWHSCVVHPLVTIWPRVGGILHTVDEFHCESALARLQRAAIVIDDEPVQSVLRRLAETEPFGAHLPHRHTLYGVVHNLIAHPLMWLSPHIGYYIHERVTTPNLFVELVVAVRGRKDRRDELTFDELCGLAEFELLACPRD